MQKNENKEINVIVVNNDYEKMEHKKRAIVMNNAAAIKTNKSIEKARRVNGIATLITATILSALAGFYFWNNFNFKFQNVSIIGSKCLVVALIIVVIFFAVEALSLPFNTRLKKKRQNVLALGEAITFTTFLRNKKITHYSITKYKDIPFVTQKVFLTIQAVDESGYVTEYVSVDSWNLYLLPFVFETMIDAENTSIYLPCENDDVADEVRDTIKDQIVEERISIEREEKEKAEKQVANLSAEKQAMERLLHKREEEITTLNDKIAHIQDQLDTVDNRFGVERSQLLATIQSEKEQKERLSVTVADLQENINTISQTLTECESREAALKTALSDAETAHKTEINEIRKQQEEKVATLELTNRTMREECEKNISTLKKQHEQEKKDLTERFATAAQKAKDALEHKYLAEIDDLKQELSVIAEKNNTEELTEELTRVQEALRKETLTRTARDKELVFEKEKIKSLEEKVYTLNQQMNGAVQAISKEKEDVEQQLLNQINLYNKLTEDKAMAEASFGVQERALIKDKELLVAKNKSLEEKLCAMDDYDQVKAENAKLKEEIECAKREDIETVKRECAEAITAMQAKVAQAEKKAREANDSAAHEKSERIRAQEILRHYLTEKEQEAYAEKKAAQDAEMEKAKKMAEKAKQDSIQAQESTNVPDTTRRAPRHLNY